MVPYNQAYEMTYVTLSAKSSLILGENKAGFCRECHILLSHRVLYCYFLYIVPMDELTMYLCFFFSICFSFVVFCIFNIMY